MEKTIMIKEKPKNKPGRPRKVPLDKEDNNGDSDVQPMDESGGSGTKRTLSDITPMGPSSSTELPRRQPLSITSSFSPERQHPV